MMKHPLSNLARHAAFCVVAAVLAVAPAEAGILFSASLDGSQEVPPNVSTATGFGTVLLNDTEDMISVNLSFSGLSASAVAAHIHGPALPGVNAAVKFPLMLGSALGATSGTIAEQVFAITATDVTHLKNGLFYFNVHTTTFPGGEIRGQISQVVPEPSTLVLSVMGLAAFGWRQSRRRLNR